MLFLVIHAIVQGALAFPAVQNAASCAHDDLYTSLSRDGGIIDSYAIYIISIGQAIFILCVSYGELHFTGQSNGTASYTSWRNSHGPATTHRATQARSSESDNGEASKTDSGDDSGTGTGRTSLASQTTNSNDVGTTDRASVEPSSILQPPTNATTSSSEAASAAPSGIAGSDTGSMTGKVTRTSRGSSQEITTSSPSDSLGSVSSKGSATGGTTPGTTDGSAIPSQIASTTAKGGGSSTDDITNGGTATETARGGEQTSTLDASEPSSNGGFTTQSSAASGPHNSGSGSSASDDTTPTSITNTLGSSFTYTGSTPTITSLNVSSTTGWNSSVTSSPRGTGTGGSLPATSTTSLTSRILSGPSSSFGSSGTVSATTDATTTATHTSPPFITPSGFNGSTISRIANATQTGPPPLPAANFTQVTRTGAIVKPTCYQMPEPQGGSTRRALLHNTKLREENATIPFPYIESVDFQTDGVDPLYLTLRDAAEGTHYIDVSNRSYIAIVDSLYNAMIIDAKGIHFSTKKCQYDVSITIDSMYEQLAALSGQVCSAGDQRRKRMSDMDFQQTLYLRDQCNNPIKPTVRRYPQLKIGDTDCNDIEVDEGTGRWLFDCTFPGSDSGTMRCEWAVRNDIEEFLFTDPFGGACPDLSTVITTLEANGQDFINPESLRTELYNQGLDDAQKAEANLIVIYYEQLWEILKQAFSKLRTQPPGKASAIQEYIDVYNQYRNFEDDICEDLHAGDMPLKMSLRAGVTTVDAIARLNWAPENPKPFNVTVQDPAQLACCSPGSNAKQDEAAGTCAYPFSAHLGDTGCVCGKTASGASVAFEITECDNFVSQCESDDDCSKAGHPRYVCLTGSCCGGGVCVDPYECAQNGTLLVRPGLF
ncbi:hypothetical protein Trco_004968 [Trichoderma cornu-damae]|uniref:Uncharacterized protein n=1 Tax=Trichoderma cornu-damae TaxID=654480 RepID=A0A9P8QI62_9HYPO|nr:hypothetical protein Trco_004968 [Trichoderma cornu-damae]